MTVLDLLKPRAIVRKDHSRSNSALDRIDAALKAVSYTHLTLPTIYSV